MLQCLLLSFKYWLLNSFSYAINRSNIGPIPIYLSSFSDINHNFFFLISANEKELALDTNSHKSSLPSFLFLDDKWMTDDKFQDFLSSQISGKPYFISYLPQHCLYFFPLPHGLWYWGFWQLLGALCSLFWRLIALGSTL